METTISVNQHLAVFIYGLESKLSIVESNS
jgi:hypothetical protein